MVHLNILFTMRIALPNTYESGAIAILNLHYFTSTSNTCSCLHKFLSLFISLLFRSFGPNSSTNKKTKKKIIIMTTPLKGLFSVMLKSLTPS